MGSLPVESRRPWVTTPCVFSPQLSKLTGCNIHLKLENVQPSGSFKSRGIGNLMTRAAASRAGDVHFYSSSGGNAGLACATSALSLKQPATIVIPTSTPALVKYKLLDLGVQVHQVGNSWVDADKYLREELLAKDPAGVYVPPFDHPHIWEGASSIIAELRDQMDVPIDGIVCSVGGGGLVNGIMHGLDTMPLGAGPPPQVLAVETIGADSLNASVRAGEHVTLPGITSIATTLGTTRVSARTWQWSQERSNFKSLVVPDADAALSCVRFADDARLVVEVSCGATLAIAYRGDLRDHLGKGLTDEEWSRKNVVMIVCGGSAVTLDILQGYRDKYSGHSGIKV